MKLFSFPYSFIFQSFISFNPYSWIFIWVIIYYFFINFVAQIVQALIIGYFSWLLCPVDCVFSLLFFSFFLWALGFWHCKMCLFSEMSFIYFLSVFSVWACSFQEHSRYHTSLKRFLKEWMCMASTNVSGQQQQKKKISKKTKTKTTRNKCNNSKSTTEWNASAWHSKVLKLLLHHELFSMCCLFEHLWGSQA